MPALPNAPGSVRVAVAGTFNGRTVANILHFNAGVSAYTQSELNGLATSVRATWVTNMLPLITSAYSVTTVTTTDLTSPTAFVGSATGSDPGGSGGVTQSAQVATCITWRIGRHYRGGHPRTYLVGPGAASNYTLPGSFSGAFLTLTATRIAAMLTAIGGFTPPSGGVPWSLCCLHYKLNGAVLTLPTPDPITAGVVNARVDTQRRRLGH